MRTKVKLGLYVVTLLGTLVFGMQFLGAWKATDAPAASVGTPVAVNRQGKPAARPAAKSASTNAAAGAVAGTNAPGAAAIPTITNAPPEPGSPPPAEVAAAELTPEQEAVPSKVSLGARSRGMGRIVMWGLLAVGALIGLGCLVAYDVSHLAAGKATRVLFNDDPGELDVAAYDEIEKANAGGEYLEAIRLLRDFLKKNPKAVHAQIRIAEIYEKELNNPLAAALEYEEVLGYRLDLERRGWTSIHLVNLYNRLDKPDRAIELLQRVVLECPDTPAAAKARERLAAVGIEAADAAGAPDPQGPADEDPPSGLPRGFKRK